MTDFSPGTLVTARGREWLVLGGSTPEVLRLRPLTGTEEDEARILLDLEPVGPARFPPPTPEQRAGHDAALLLRDALLLSLRRGAGPFRSFGQIAVEPRAYQLVPLLMALKLDPVRLLIADDVGVGKTIEAGLIARELLDRGEITGFTVLCPPHLVEQWTAELQARFHIQAVAVTAAGAQRLERNLPPGTSLFAAHPFTVVSLDYIKADRRRDYFRTHCPELVLVDEAHTCAGGPGGRHQRYELLRSLVEDPARHLLLLTATPHSGDDAAFYRLLGLLDPAFARLGEVTGAERDKLRDRLAAHFVQRRRPDIDAWQAGQRLFPKRESSELTYRLTGRWQAFFEAVLDYCAAVVQAAEGDELRRRLNFWGTLALLRCAASSPAAAVLALRTRAGLADDAENRAELLDRLFDGEADALTVDDTEPPATIEDSALASLVEQAIELAGLKGDPKRDRLTGHVRDLVAAGYSPVIFCRYIATAHYLHRHLQTALGDVTVGVVTGEQPADQRQEAVEALSALEAPHVLVATDCLSEGINLQEGFDAVVHYDLSWNPTRHEQREGRVDRFGQPKAVVRTTLMYGADNPVDGAVLEVILRKAEAIRRELGVPVPLPDEGHTLSQALLQAVLLRRTEKTGVQLTLDLPEAKQIDARWQHAKKNITVFAQRRLKPEEVLPEWQRTRAVLGDAAAVKRFVSRAFLRLGSGLEEVKKGGYKVPLAPLPEDLKDRLEAEGLSHTLRIDFDYPPAGRCLSLQRSHPLVTVLAEGLLERTLAEVPPEAREASDERSERRRGVARSADRAADSARSTDPGILGRVGCWTTTGVTARTVVALLRLRHQISGRTPLLVEEATAFAWAGSAPIAEGDAAFELLVPPPAGDPLPHVRDRMVRQALDLDARMPDLEAFAARRAQALLEDHDRVRTASRVRAAGPRVKPISAPDVIALFVLLPVEVPA